jgi:hypothetical protein
MIIIGSGIAGKMAAGYFKNFRPQIYEARREDEGSGHKAIMRFRDDRIGLLLGASLEKINVSKAIYYNGKFIEQNPMLINLYSRKVAKGIYSRSIHLMDSVDRYIATGSFSAPLTNYGYELDKVEPNKCFFSNGEVVDYDVCISTIPLPVICKAAGFDTFDVDMISYPIYVTRAKINIPSNVYQTIYFPDPKLSVYRASLECQNFIIESDSEYIEQEIPEICLAFGLHQDYLEDKESYVQDNGKIIDMDDSIRKHLILELTEKFSIYSIGRYATWRNITSDVLLDDLPKIENLMKLSNSARKYSMKLEHAE